MSKDFENFKKFEEFFSNTKPDGILSWNRGNAFIELDWMFSDLLERKYVKQAIANIMQKNNPTYKQNCKYKNNKNPEDIDGFSIVRKKGKIILRFSGNDNYTIVDLYGNENEQYNEKSALNKINFTQLNDEIMNVITKENKVNDAGAKLIIAGIEQAENEAFGNLIEYYKYLIDEKEQSKKHIERVCNDHGRNVYCIGISVLSDDAEFLCCGKYFGTCHGSGKFYSAEGFDDDDDSKCSTSDHRDCVCRKRIRR